MPPKTATWPVIAETGAMNCGRNARKNSAVLTFRVSTTIPSVNARLLPCATILTTVTAERGGILFPQITDVFPCQEVIDRTFINTWQDPKVVDAVKATGRKQLIIAGLWTEVCVAMPTIRALGEGWDVTVVTDASGGVSVEAHKIAIRRMIMAGANMIVLWI
ncbi:isochorismatase family protein [Herbaspirillum sp. RV1423]|uniref:isochorismatase family protein n=1 Tax=Herbaspirillum sp. RV1423 TaxID=1443993 RepID=UPI0009DD12E0|nr:isochorismatase family protein [Herbaspirillum sp. RV1423]